MALLCKTVKKNNKTKQQQKKTYNGVTNGIMYIVSINKTECEVTSLKRYQRGKFHEAEL